MQEIFLNTTEKERVFYFTFTSFTAPIIGVVIGGIFTTKLGGYNSKSAQIVQCSMSVLAVFFAFPIPFLNSFPAFLGLLWMVLFAGGFCLPSVTGIMINSVN